MSTASGRVDGSVWERLDTLEPEVAKPGLRRIEALLEHLDAPHLHYPTAVIAGTNGKGSAAAMLATIGRSAGLRVGCYTSPHLQDLEERFRVDLSPISRDGLAAHLEVVLAAADALLGDRRIDESPSYFEVLTAVAFRYFAEARVDVAVLEVGLGGRLDAINVTRPRVAVIMPVAVDHTAWLGSDLPAIAAEKFAVVPSGGLAVVAPQREEVAETIREAARSRGVTLLEATAFPFEVRGVDERLRYAFDCAGRLRSYGGLEVRLPGRHQLDNARCALLAAEALDRRRMRIGSDAIWDGLRQVEWPGRCEWLGEHPPVLLDGAHNPAAALALAAYLHELRERGAYRRLHLVLGVLTEKDHEGLAAALFPLADTLVATEPPSPRARPAGSLVEAGGSPATRFEIPEPGAALRRAMDIAAPDDLVCVTGSLYLVGAVRPHLVT